MPADGCSCVLGPHLLLIACDNQYRRGYQGCIIGLSRFHVPSLHRSLFVVLGLGLALAACSGDPEPADSAPSDADETAQESSADEGGDATSDEADEQSTDEPSNEEEDEGEPVAIDGCPATSETVSDIVGSALVAGDPQDTIGDGVTCAYLHETDLYPDAAVTVGNWDGSEEFRDDLVDTNTGRFGEPTDTPADLGEEAFLWNPSGEQTTLLLFDAGRYYTTTVNGIDDTDQKRDIVVSLYEAAR